MLIPLELRTRVIGINELVVLELERVRFGLLLELFHVLRVELVAPRGHYLLFRLARDELVELRDGVQVLSVEGVSMVNVLII